MEEIFNAQRLHAQLIMVGDSAQAIYGWRGARDVMTGFDGLQLTLSQSFRFGPALAEEANRWLQIVESPLRLRGTPTIDTRIGPLQEADAVLCRTNSGAISEIFRLLDEGKRVALVGGERGLRDLARAAGELKAGRRATHPELVLFQTWAELQEYAEEDPAGHDLLPLVDIIDKHGVTKVLDAMDRLHAEEDAQVTLSTAHRAKGREWPAVRIGRSRWRSWWLRRGRAGCAVPWRRGVVDAVRAGAGSSASRVRRGPGLSRRGVRRRGGAGVAGRSTCRGPRRRGVRRQGPPGGRGRR
ncbi:hypothetical protein [Streptomyces virginiae]|uniref:hypothetical protein n=1 Tax=Streptomyces virginiae TaxID=1961 RepID=UPI00370210F3